MALPDSRKALLWSAFFVFWAVGFPVLADHCARPGAGEPVASRQVIDGDTLDLVDGRRVRLIGINAPEIGRRGSPSEPYAQTARRELQRLATEKGLRLLVGKEPKDKYGRTLGHLFDARGANVEARLLEQGLGFAVGIAPNLQLLDCHLRIEREARLGRRGLWKHAPVGQAEQLGGGGFRILRGRVARVSRTDSHIWMDLEGPLTLRLPPALIEPREDGDWLRREVEVRGWIVDRGAVGSGRKRYMLPVDDLRLMRRD